MFEKKINIDYLKLAKIAYGGEFYFELKNYKQKSIDLEKTNFEKVTDTLLSQRGNTDFYSYKREETGFVCNVFEDVKKGTIVIAYRGTERLGLGENVSDLQALLKDVLTDINLMLGNIDIQFQDAWDFYKCVKEQNPDKKIIIVGQSLGGALAQLVPAKEYTVNRKKIESYSYNAPGCKHLLRVFDCGENLNYSFITNYSVMNDWCGMFGERVGTCYLIPPIPMNEVDNDSAVEVINNMLLTTHEGIFDYTEEEMGKVIRKPKNFNQTEGLSLWYFDKNNPMKYYKSMPDFINSITQKYNLPPIDLSENSIAEKIKEVLYGNNLEENVPISSIVKNATESALAFQEGLKGKIADMVNSNIVSVAVKELEFIFSQISAESIKNALKILVAKANGRNTHKAYISGIVEYLSGL